MATSAGSVSRRRRRCGILWSRRRCHPAPRRPRPSREVAIDPAVLAALASWSLDPVVALGLLALLVAYLRGARRLARHGGLDRQIGRGRAATFVLGWLLLVVALLSPVATFGEVWLSAHMTQHLLLSQIAAPLVLLGRPVPTILLGLPDRLRRDLAPLLAGDGALNRLGRRLVNPLVASALFLGSLVLWHIPVAYDLAVQVTAVHYIEHLTFFLTALLFWWPAVDPLGADNRRRFWSVLAQAVAFAVTSALGVYLTFAKQVVYASYRDAPRVFGVGPLDDQITAGLIMWVGGGLLLSGTLLATLAAATAEQERRQQRRERLTDLVRETG